MKGGRNEKRKEWEKAWIPQAPTATRRNVTVCFVGPGLARPIWNDLLCSAPMRTAHVKVVLLSTFICDTLTVDYYTPKQQSTENLPL